MPLPRSLFQWGGDTPFPDPTPYSILAPTALDLATPRLQIMDPPLTKLFKLIVQHDWRQFCYQQTFTAVTGFADDQTNRTRREIDSPSESIRIDYSKL